MIGYCGGSVSVFEQGVKEGEIWEIRTEDNILMYQTHQYIESHNETTTSIQSGLKKYHSIKDKDQFNQIVQGMIAGGGNSSKITSLKKVFTKALKATEDDKLGSLLHNSICGTCKYLRSYRCVQVGWVGGWWWGGACK